MLNVYVPTPLPQTRQLPLLEDPREDDNRLFQKTSLTSFEGIITIVQNPIDADVFLLPHNYADIRSRTEYIEKVSKEAVAAGKKLVVFSSQDDPAPLSLSNAIVFRPSVYRSSLQPNEIVMPAQIEDIGAQYGIAFCSKGEKPTVGFVGKAGFDRVRDAFRYYVRNYLIRRGPAREGIYFRRRALALLRHDTRIDLRAIMRKRFSAHAKSIELAPEVARSEYIQNIQSSLFTLAPRGDGNYSLRFYETLSLGRIPILIDTDMVLPLEDRIPYDDFILRIPSTELAQLSNRILRFWQAQDDASLQAMQTRAREVFEKQLSLPTFLRATLTKEFLTPYL